LYVEIQNLSFKIKAVKKIIKHFFDIEGHKFIMKKYVFVGPFTRKIGKHKKS